MRALCLECFISLLNPNHNKHTFIIRAGRDPRFIFNTIVSLYMSKPCSQDEINCWAGKK